MRALQLLALCAALLLAACAQVLGPRTVLVSQQELQQKVAQRFPLQRSVLDLLMLTVETPELSLQPAVARMALRLTVKVQDRFSKREYRGWVGLSFAPKFDPTALTLGLTRVNVDEVQIDGVSDNVKLAITRVASKLAQDQLEGYVVYRVKPQDLGRADSLGYTVGAVDVTEQGLAIQLVARPH